MTSKSLWALMAGAVLLGGLAAPVEASSAQDKAIIRAFEDVLDRQPTESELRRYRDLMYEEYWTERDVREDLRHRSDYGRRSDRRVEDPDRIVRRAYQDILHREPDPEGLRLYRSRIIDDNWTEYQVREALRKSPEHAQRSSESADKIVRRAYQDILGREPDTNGLYSYRNKVLNQGWDEHDVREALRKSPEYRQKNAMTREQAEEVVRRAYESVLGREPDPASRGYVDRVLRDHWTERDIARELRNSEEYRNKQR
jgi:TorA maturation chaperone TorD